MSVQDISVKPMKVIWNSIDLGSTSGGVEISLDTQSVDITIDQSGSNILDSFVTGVTVSLSVTIMELNATNYNAMIASTIGDSFTPAEGGTFVGIGTSNNFSSLFSKAQQLELRPVDATDSTNSWTFWKAVAMPSSLSFAADNASTMTVEFKIFPDSTKTSEVSIGVLGDNTLTYTA